MYVLSVQLPASASSTQPRSLSVNCTVFVYSCSHGDSVSTRAVTVTGGYSCVTLFFSLRLLKINTACSTVSLCYVTNLNIVYNPLEVLVFLVLVQFIVGPQWWKWLGPFYWPNTPVLKWTLASLSACCWDPSYGPVHSGLTLARYSLNRFRASPVPTGTESWCIK